MNQKIGGSAIAAAIALFALLFFGGPGGTLYAGVFGLASAGLFLFGLLEDGGF